ncbi:MAG: AAA family ATPase [Lachnospiraceae bacterium]|nr:AAA family ATPase [Lachnospiraceae bacterium]
MIIKKYQAANEADAIILAKEELGKNVIIMNVKKINSKGLARLFKKSKVEITAAIDDGKSYENEETKDKKEQLEQELLNAIKEKQVEDKENSNKNNIKNTKNIKKNKKSKKQKSVEELLQAKSRELEDIVEKEEQLELIKDKSSLKSDYETTNNKKDNIFDKTLEKKDLSKENFTSEELKEEILKALEKNKANMLKKQSETTTDRLSISKSSELEKPVSKNSKIDKKETIEKKEAIDRNRNLAKSESLDNTDKAHKSEKVDKNDKSDKYVKLIKKQLLKHEVDEKYIDMIINEVKGNIKKDTLVDNILTSVYQKIILKLGTPKLIEPGDNQPRYVFFMGPTGVGKTTTIAKIASDFKLNRKLNIALLSLDTYRLAAVEQLRIYANILKIPLHVAYSAEDITKLKRELDRYDVVLIDTAGRSHKNKEQGDELRELISTIDIKERDMYLVLSATTKYSDLINIVEAYKDIKEYKLLFTKTDETTHLGNILNIKLYTDAKLSYIANGQDVPTDIGKVDAQEIAKQLLGGGM